MLATPREQEWEDSCEDKLINSSPPLCSSFSRRNSGITHGSSCSLSPNKGRERKVENNARVVLREEKKAGGSL